MSLDSLRAQAELVEFHLAKAEARPETPFPCTVTVRVTALLEAEATVAALSSPLKSCLRLAMTRRLRDTRRQPSAAQAR